jgi:hypothetical protein
VLASAAAAAAWLLLLLMPLAGSGVLLGPAARDAVLPPAGGVTL